MGQTRKSVVGKNWKRILKKRGKVFLIDENGMMTEIENPRQKEYRRGDFLRYRPNKGTGPL